MDNYLDEGQQAKDFTLRNGQGEEVSLSDFRGKKVILYFYPKDNTPGCTKEACGFRDSFGDFEQANTVVIGVSKDSVKKHANFAAKFELPFMLLSDEEGQVIEDYGVWKSKKNYGKEYMGIVRTTYVIDEDGIVLKVFPKVRVAGHIEKVLEFVQA